jgi:hypothetical protein
MAEMKTQDKPSGNNRSEKICRRQHCCAMPACGPGGVRADDHDAIKGA